mmetsp:Transcript_81105/g.173451  ORF Transcript_81105/g.173451 Transcript_81105/m.173451 type:complete len:315 (+) Transcript_81105:593-1537(+)
MWWRPRLPTQWTWGSRCRSVPQMQQWKRCPNGSLKRSGGSRKYRTGSHGCLLPRKNQSIRDVSYPNSFLVCARRWLIWPGSCKRRMDIATSRLKEWHRQWQHWNLPRLVMPNKSSKPRNYARINGTKSRRSVQNCRSQLPSWSLSVIGMRPSCKPWKSSRPELLRGAKLDQDVPIPIQRVATGIETSMPRPGPAKRTLRKCMLSQGIAWWRGSSAQKVPHRLRVFHPCSTRRNSWRKSSRLWQIRPCWATECVGHRVQTRRSWKHQGELRGLGGHCLLRPRHRRRGGQCRRRCAALPGPLTPPLPKACAMRRRR